MERLTQDALVKGQAKERFKPGQLVYVVERDECGYAVEVTGYMFLATAGQGTILSAFHSEDGLEATIKIHIVETAEYMHTDLYVYPVEDVYSARQEAIAALTSVGGVG